MPIDHLPDNGTGNDSAYEMIRTELLLDGQARLNLATFVTTWMPKPAALLMAETADKNMIDKDEYPQTAEIESRCVNILADLWNSPEHETATGCSTTGSSEAAMLAGMALKWRWRDRMKTAGKPTDRPNLVMGANVQVCWEKFCRYWEVEPRLVPMEGETFHLTAERAVAALRREHDRRGGDPRLDLRRQLRAGQGDRRGAGPARVRTRAATCRCTSTPPRAGSWPPFWRPDLEWDFRLQRVQSINASGHKYGLVYPGVGWAIWRDKEALPQRPGLRRQLPRRQHADVRAELLAARAARSWPSTSCS